MNDMIKSVENMLNINLNKYGSNIGPRVIAQQICREVMQYLEQNPNGVVVFDLSGVTSISTGFAFDLFGSLYKKYAHNFPGKVKFVSPPQEYADTLRSSIQRGISGVLKNAEE